MTNPRDPMALLRHAAQAGDWGLVEAVTRLLTGRPVAATAASRAYGSLVFLLGLAHGSYDRA